MTKESLLLLQEQQPCCLRYQLMGAILHVSDDSHEHHDDDNEEENGHYVTLVQSRNGPEWNLFNDDQVTLLPNNEQQVLDMLSGHRAPSDNNDDLDGSSVLYHSLGLWQNV